jgi:hypothetical protein
MPKDLPGLLRWYADQCSNETPTGLHKHELWKDSRTQHEIEQGYHTVGGSELGSPAYNEDFRQRLENSPSQTDEEGYYVRPVASALARIGRHGKPLMARHLLLLASAGFDWRVRAAAIGGYALK